MKKFPPNHWLLIALFVISFFHYSSRANAALANVWHIPDNNGDLGFNMRNPESAIGQGTPVAFYTGLWKWNNGNQIANQTVGMLFYKTSAQSVWNRTNLSFYSNTSANQYWQTTLNPAGFSPGDVVQYYFLLTFDGFNNVSNTCLYGTDSASSTTGDTNVAAANPFTFTITNNLSIGTPVLTVNGVNADYTTTHVFVNEVKGDSIPLTILFSPNASNVVEADVFSNLNRRNRATLDANGDGIEDGIVPPDGNTIPTGDDHNYYKAYAMTPTSTPGQYSFTLNATNCGAYRLSARYKISGNTNWFWYSTNGRRDHCLVVTPTRARDMVLYELNAMNINSQGTLPAQRSTFTDLYGGPGARPYDAVTNRFSLNYVQNLGVNWLWFQPIHPIGILNRQIDPNTGQPYSVGSPYAVKNYFQVNPLLSKANTRDAAMQEFTNFVAAADAAGINVMLDEPFNHTAWDCELDASGVYYFATNAQPTDEIANSEARFYSRTNEYDQRASSAANIAPAPDRFDFGKWTDVADIYFGVTPRSCRTPRNREIKPAKRIGLIIPSATKILRATATVISTRSRKIPGVILPTAFCIGSIKPVVRPARRRIKWTPVLTVCVRILAKGCRRKLGNTSSTKSARANGILCS